MNHFFEDTSVWPVKIAKCLLKLPQKWFPKQNERFWQLYKNCLQMWEIWAKWMLPQALKSCPKCNKLPNLVTLASSLTFAFEQGWFLTLKGVHYIVIRGTDAWWMILELVLTMFFWIVKFNIVLRLLLPRF